MASNALLRALLEGDDDFDDFDAKEVSRPLPEAVLARLREAYERYAEACEFKPGDVVTIRKDAPLRGHGQPHIVVEIDQNAPLGSGNPGDWPSAARTQVIILGLHGGHIAPHRAAHWMLERYSAA